MTQKINPKIILASNSPRRIELAKQMGLSFTVTPSNFIEDMDQKKDPIILAKEMSYGKALEVSKRKKGIIIGVDTFVVLNGKFLGKPKSQNDAFMMLKSVSGKVVKVVSGITIIDTSSNKIITDSEITKVYLRKISDQEIKDYISTGEPRDKAGAFAIQGLGGIFIKKIDGCYFNVVGFPIYNIFKNLSKLNVKLFNFKRWKS